MGTKTQRQRGSKRQRIEPQKQERCGEQQSEATSEQARGPVRLGWEWGAEDRQAWRATWERPSAGGKTGKHPKERFSKSERDRDRMEKGS